MLTKKDENKITDIVVDVIQDVVMPAFETLNTKIDKIKTSLENRLDRVENRLDQIDRKLDVVSGKVLDHDYEIKQLKRSTATP